MKYELPNIFLHFLNRDTQEIFGLQDNSENAVSNIQKALNASILLCREFCILPVGFYFESGNTKKIILDNIEYIREGLIVFAMREKEIQEYIEKKQGQLKKFMNDANYYRFFENDNKELVHIKNATISRKTKIGEYCLLRWEKNVALFVEDYNGDISEIYSIDKKTTGADAISVAKAIQKKSKEIEGGAFIWKLMADEFEKFKERDPVLQHQMRRLFESYYYRAYLDEYKASILFDIFPFDHNEDFLLKKGYLSASNYRWFYEFLKCLEIASVLECNAVQISNIKRWPEFEHIVQTYLQICNLDSFTHSTDSIRKETSPLYIANINDLKDITESLKSKLHQLIYAHSGFSVAKKKAGSEPVNINIIQINNPTRDVEVIQDMKIEFEKAGKVNIAGEGSTLNDTGTVFIAGNGGVINFQTSFDDMKQDLEKILPLAGDEDKNNIDEAISAIKEKDEGKFVKALKKAASFMSSIVSKVAASVLFEYMKHKGILVP